MNATFQDLEEINNPLNGYKFTEATAVVNYLKELSRTRSPFICELIGENGFTLTIGVRRDFACVQYAASDGTPPYMMVVAPPERPKMGEAEFLVGGTPTPIDSRFCISFHRMEKVVETFMETGIRSFDADWEEF